MGRFEEQVQGLHTLEAGCLQDASREDCLPHLPPSLQHGHLPTFLEKKREDSRDPQSTWEPHGDEIQLDQEEGTPEAGRFLENSMASIQQHREEAKEVTGMEAEDKRSLPGTEAQGTAEGMHKGEVAWGHDQGRLAHGFRGRVEKTAVRSEPGQAFPNVQGQARCLQGLGTKEDYTTEKSTGVSSVTRQEEQAEAEHLLSM